MSACGVANPMALVHVLERTPSTAREFDFGERMGELIGERVTTVMVPSILDDPLSPETGVALPVAWEEVVAIFVLAQGNNGTTGSAGEDDEEGGGGFSQESGRASAKMRRSNKGSGDGGDRSEAAPVSAPLYAETWMSRLRCELLLLEGQMLSHTGRLSEAEKRLTRLHRELSQTGRAETITACSAYTTIAEM